MAEILPSHVRDFLNALERQGVSPYSIKYCKAILDAIFTTALNDRVIFLHPGKGVKAPVVPPKPRTIISPEQFEVIYEALPSKDFRLLVETGIESGARWGKLTELRVRDIDLGTGS